MILLERDQSIELKSFIDSDSCVVIVDSEIVSINRTSIRMENNFRWTVYICSARHSTPLQRFILLLFFGSVGKDFLLTLWGRDFFLEEK